MAMHIMTTSMTMVIRMRITTTMHTTIMVTLIHRPPTCISTTL